MYAIKEVSIKNLTVLSVGRQYDHKKLAIRFTGMEHPELLQWLKIKPNYQEEPLFVPLNDGLFIVGQPFTKYKGMHLGQLMIKTDDNRYIENSYIFNIEVEPSIGSEDIYENVDPNIEALYDKMLNTLNTVEIKLENGEFNGKDGTDGEDGQPGKDGLNGKDGENGITPHIGDNDNWFLGAEDTGKPSKGEDYKHSEEFTQLAQQVRQDKTSVEQTVQSFGNTVQQAEQSIGNAGVQMVQKVTEEGAKQLKAVQDKGNEVLQSIPEDFPAQMESKLDKSGHTPDKYLGTDNKGNVVEKEAPTGGDAGTTDYNDLENKPKINGTELSGEKSLEDLGIQPEGDYALKNEIPTALPNPHKLTFSGAVKAEYDGSDAVVITIPEGSTIERIEKLVADTVVELEANKLYIFPEMANLTYTLKPQADDVASEYHFIFKSGTVPTQVVHPVGLNTGKLSIGTNKIYEISIMENLLISQSWEVQ